MSKIDTLRHQVDRLLEAMPAPPVPVAEDARVWLGSLTDDELDQLHVWALERIQQGGTLEGFDSGVWWRRQVQL